VGDEAEHLSVHGRDRCDAGGAVGSVHDTVVVPLPRDLAVLVRVSRRPLERLRRALG
jgi:hypothetical protein